MPISFHILPQNSKKKKKKRKNIYYLKKEGKEKKEVPTFALKFSWMTAKVNEYLLLHVKNRRWETKRGVDCGVDQGQASVRSYS